MTLPSSKLPWVLRCFVSGLLFGCTVGGAWGLWYIGDAVSQRSQHGTISKNAAENLETVAQALYWYLLPVLLVSALLAMFNLYLSFVARSPAFFFKASSPNKVV